MKFLKIHKAYISLLFIICVIIFSSFSYFLKIVFETTSLSSSIYIKDLLLFCLIGVTAFFCLVQYKIYFNFRISDIFLCLYLFFCLISFFKSPLPLFDCVKFFWAMCFGPLLYITIRLTKMNRVILDRCYRVIFVWILFLILSGILIYLIGQEKILRDIGLLHYMEVNWGTHQVGALYRVKSGFRFMRMTGFLLTPLDMGFMLVFLFGFYMLYANNFVKKNILGALWILTYLLCDTRSPLLGTFVGFLSLWCINQKGYKKIIYILGILVCIPLCCLIAFSLGMFNSLIEPSALFHINDLLVRGPKLVLENWAGVGVGMTSAGSNTISAPEGFIGVVESYYYSMSIQIGICGLILYLITIITLLIEIRRDSLFIKKFSVGLSKRYDVAFFLIIALHFAVIFLPVLDSKAISSIMWSLIAMAYNTRTLFSFEQEQTSNCLKNSINLQLQKV
jgi:hypothetical protein